MINSISGKPTTKLFTEVNVFTQDYESALKIALQNTKDGQDENDNIICLGDGQYIVKQKLTEEEAHKKDCKPCFLSSLIYTYARRKMLDIYSYGFDDAGNNIGSVYTDTDSLLIEESCCQKMLDEFPHWFGKNFGQMEFEDHTAQVSIIDNRKVVRGLIVGFACFAPKCYFIFGEG